MRARLGYFEVLPKVRYNLPLARVARQVPLPPDAPDELPIRTAQLALMPDHATLVLDYAFEHPELDPVSLFPGAPRASVGRVRTFARSTIRVVSDAVRGTAFLHPLAMVLLLACAWRLRAGPRRLEVAALLALFGLHLVPAIFAGEDFEQRYLSAAMMFSVPLVAGGAEALSARARSSRARALALAALASVYALTTARLARQQAGGPRAWAHLSAIEQGCRDHVPLHARLLDMHTRDAWLREGIEHVVPYPRDADEMRAYVEHYQIEYAVLDPARLRATGNAVHRELLAEPRAWPPAWRLIATVGDAAAPVYLVRLR
jgi:hypothetical protein